MYKYHLYSQNVFKRWVFKPLVSDNVTWETLYKKRAPQNNFFYLNDGRENHRVTTSIYNKPNLFPVEKKK